MSTLSDLQLFIDQNVNDCDAGPPASPDLIRKAEEFLEVRFPDEYRAFLSRWGTLAIGPLEFYGLCDDDFVNSSVPDAVWYTHNERSKQGLPKSLVILCDNNGVEYFCIDTSRQDECRIVTWDVVSRSIRGVKAHSLVDFILSESADSL